MIVGGWNLVKDFLDQANIFFFRDRDRYGYQVTVWHSEEADRLTEKDLGEKDLGLPARSRFGEGRAKPLSIQFGRSKAGQIFILTDDHRYP
jgi:hypothetical protein